MWRDIKCNTAKNGVKPISGVIEVEFDVIVFEVETSVTKYSSLPTFITAFWLLIAVTRGLESTCTLPCVSSKLSTPLKSLFKKDKLVIPPNEADISFAKLPEADLAPADLGEFLLDVERSVAAIADDVFEDEPAPEVTFKTQDVPMPVRLDAMMLKRCVDNLIRNAFQALSPIHI